jgi:hypothetical protein
MYGESRRARHYNPASPVRLRSEFRGEPLLERIQARLHARSELLEPLSLAGQLQLHRDTHGASDSVGPESSESRMISRGCAP